MTFIILLYTSIMVSLTYIYMKADKKEDIGKGQLGRVHETQKVNALEVSRIFKVG